MKKQARRFLCTCAERHTVSGNTSHYKLNELSVDNIIDLERAVNELGEFIPIAGNVDPVEVILNGGKEEITEAVTSCIHVGKKASKGYTLATGCDVHIRHSLKDRLVYGGQTIWPGSSFGRLILFAYRYYL